jgi:exopolysaccharide biosynthesis polyprenyl glycosylphosphotransferase
VSEVRRRVLLRVLKLYDLGLLAFCFVLATIPVAEAQGLSLRDLFAMRVKVSNLAIVAAIVLVWHLIFTAGGAYISQRLSTLRTQLRHTLIATTLSSFCLAASAALFDIRLVTLGSLVRFWTLTSVLFVLSRVSLRALLANVRRNGRNLRHLLILGTNSRARDFARKLQERPDLGYRVLGFVDDEWKGSADFIASNENLCCDFEAFPEFLRRNIVDEVAIYLPLQTFYERTCQIAALCERHGVIMRFDSDIFNLKIARSRPEVLAGHPLVITYAGHFEDWPSIIKRVLDFSVSVVLLILFSPLMLLVALLIRMTSPGPLLFLQERVGLNKRKFMIYKFRTMVDGAEKMLCELEMLNEVAGPVFKIKNDPRMTPLGKFLRRTSIDELPQLFNVLKGDMSLVGPRPLPVRDYEGFNEDWQRRRFSIRPGITCLWQISGRSSITFTRWMELDLQYMDEWSLWLDLRILAQTIPAVLKGSGAA